MRAKRSKKYRKIMQAYQLAFGFREPYQVLLDSNFIRTCHSFHMPLQKYVDNTLHGQSNLFVTKCSLAKIMADHEKAGGHPRSRPQFLPPPTELPLRHCKHKDGEGQDLGVVSEARCLLDLLAGQPHGNELAKNKQHFILATADAAEEEYRRRGHVDVRETARLIPGVPIVYVKRSVMILEEMSGTSAGVRRKDERDKFKEGLVGSRKRKRGEAEEDEEEGINLTQADQDTGPTRRGPPKIKAPNPLSVRKKKTKPSQHDEKPKDDVQNEDGSSKPARRGKRGTKKKTTADEHGSAGITEVDGE